MNAKQYSGSDVARILGAYRSIFPRVPHTLADYWGHGRTRPWSQLTSNFHAARFEQFAALHEEARRIDTAPFANLEAKGAALRAAAHEAGVGYSLGINAWADNLLHQTFQEGLTSLTIVLAHDWYPIATVDRRGRWRKSDAPLRMDDNLHRTHTYHAAAPQAVLDGETVGLYLNLYPDYRPPSVDKTGDVGKFGYSYAQCLGGLDELVAAIDPRYTRLAVVSWGARVWTTLARRTEAAKRTNLTSYTRGATGQPLTLELGGRRFPYLPVIHPGMGTNFSNDTHYLHLAHGFRALGLGPPGHASSVGKCVLAARAVLRAGLTGA